MPTTNAHDDTPIRRLAAAYSHAVMRLDPVAAAAVYTEDGVLSAFFGPEIVGRPAIEEAFRQTFAPIKWITQSISAGVVDRVGDTARGSWTVVEWLQNRDQKGLACCFGVYEDQAVLTADGWRFKRRRFHPFYRGTVPSEGKLYRDPEFANEYSPWPLVSQGG